MQSVFCVTVTSEESILRNATNSLIHEMHLLKLTFWLLTSCSCFWYAIAGSLCVDPGWCVLTDAVVFGNGTIVVPRLAEESRIVKATERHGESPLITVLASSRLVTMAQTRKKIKFGIYKEPYYASENVGHFLGDDIFTIFSALYLWNLQSIATEDVTIVMPSQYKPVFDRLPIISELYTILSANPVLFVDHESQHAFDRLLVGWDSLCYSCVQKKYIGVPMLEAFLRRSADAFSIRPSNLRHRRRCHVTLIEKDPVHALHKYVIANAQEIERKVATTTSCTVQRVSWSSCSLPRQIDIMQRTDIALTLPGSDMMNCIFMPTKSAIISASRCNGGADCEGSNEINLWFGGMPNRHVLFYDYNTTRKYMSWSEQELTWNADHAAEAVRNASIALGVGSSA